MRMALYVIMIFIMYIADELKVMPSFWIIILGVSGMICLLRDYFEAFDAKGKKK